MNNLLTVKGVSLYFNMYLKGLRQHKAHTLKNLNLTVNEGEIIAIIGSSGSGKSLLAHAILGVLPSNAHLSGDIYYKNEPINEQTLAHLRGNEIALMPQSVNYFDQLMPVGKQVQSKSISKKAQREAFARYGLSTTDEALYPFQLSGGMARRALLSTAIAGGASLIIADEPTPGLSSDLGIEVMSNFKELAKEGRGILVITHDIELASLYADRIYVFHDGETIDTISCVDFRSGTIQHPYTKALFDALPQNNFQEPNEEILQFLNREKELANE
ncbi:MAG: ATP-binding cassette domain-containing protein [Eubacteriales bacterium]